MMKPKKQKSGNKQGYFNKLFYSTLYWRSKSMNNGGKRNHQYMSLKGRIKQTVAEILSSWKI